jgi:hypothetical protein
MDTLNGSESCDARNAGGEESKGPLKMQTT